MKITRKQFYRLLKESLLLEEDDILKKVKSDADKIIDSIRTRTGKLQQRKQVNKQAMKRISDIISGPSGEEVFKKLMKEKEGNDKVTAAATLTTIAEILKSTMERPGFDIKMKKTFDSAIAEAENAAESLSGPSYSMSDIKTNLEDLSNYARQIESYLSDNNIDIIFEDENYTSKLFDMIDNLNKHYLVREKPKQAKKSEKSKASDSSKSYKGVSGLQRLLNDMAKLKSIDIDPLESDGDWGRLTTKMYKAVVKEYSPGDENKNWSKILSKEKGKTGNVKGMIEWLLSLYDSENTETTPKPAPAPSPAVETEGEPLEGTTSEPVEENTILSIKDLPEDEESLGIIRRNMPWKTARLSIKIAFENFIKQLNKPKKGMEKAISLKAKLPTYLKKVNSTASAKGDLRKLPFDDEKQGIFSSEFLNKDTRKLMLDYYGPNATFTRNKYKLADAIARYVLYLKEEKGLTTINESHAKKQQLLSRGSLYRKRYGRY